MTPSIETTALAVAKIERAPKPTAADILRNRQMMAASTRRGGDFRGNSKDRARRTARLLAEFGDGAACECVYCGTELTAVTLTQDKIVCGGDGGRYIFENLLPACLNCNVRRSNTAVNEFIEECKAAIAHAETFLVR